MSFDVEVFHHVDDLFEPEIDFVPGIFPAGQVGASSLDVSEIAGIELDEFTAVALCNNCALKQENCEHFVSHCCFGFN